MKITDYGLWFRDYDNIWVKNIEPYRKFNIFLHGSWIGIRGNTIPLLVKIDLLKEVGFKLKSGTPGQIDSWYPTEWFFPADYIPTESDFEEIE